MSNCEKIGILVDTTIAGVEAVNIKNLTIQITDHTPQITVDKSEGVKVYLGKRLETDIVSSKVTELNISYLQEDGEFAKETPVTEQFVTRWSDKQGKFVTEPLEMFM
mmetsp:Transcript_27028/g.23931  ORF Transcript_27028/g.23931 Transcript_27028/m.23931 type:complete len:107 (-) Transcript_27028:207-527(-)